MYFEPIITIVEISLGKITINPFALEFEMLLALLKAAFYSKFNVGEAL